MSSTPLRIDTPDSLYGSQANLTWFLFVIDFQESESESESGRLENSLIMTHSWTYRSWGFSVESEETHFVENSAAGRADGRKRRILRGERILRKEKDAIQCESARAENGHNRNLSRSNRPPHISLHTRDISGEEFTNILHTSTIHLCATYISKIFQGNTEPTNTSSFQYIGIYSIDTHMLPLPLHLGHRLLQRELLAGRVGDLLQPLSQLVNSSISNKIDQNRNKRVAVMQS